MPTRLERIYLVILIFSVLWFLFGDQIDYNIDAALPQNNICQRFDATVALIKKIHGGYLYSNGVLINENTILTAKHTGVDQSFQIFSKDKLYSSQIIEIDNVSDRDLSIITIKGKLNIVPAKLSTEILPPFTLVTSRGNKIWHLYAGSQVEVENQFLNFPNGLSIGGDSGAPLLNKDCAVVAIVHGGTHSFLWNLRPASQYTVLP